MYGYQTTPVVKNLIIINILCFAATYVFSSSMGVDLNKYLALHYYEAHDFGVWQLITFLFMHSGFNHIFFNMFGLWMFGSLIEQALGSRRFIIYYLIAGMGSGIIQEIALMPEASKFVETINTVLASLNTDNINAFVNGIGIPKSQEMHIAMQTFIKEYNGAIAEGAQDQAASIARQFLDSYQSMYMNSMLTVGASGAIFGLLLAVAFIYPNMGMGILFIPVMIKAKWFVLIYCVIELFFGVSDFEFDNVAHWAHLGGALFGLILLKMWKVEKIY